MLKDVNGDASVLLFANIFRKVRVIRYFIHNYIEAHTHLCEDLNTEKKMLLGLKKHSHHDQRKPLHQLSYFRSFVSRTQLAKRLLWMKSNRAMIKNVLLLKMNDLKLEKMWCEQDRETEGCIFHLLLLNMREHPSLFLFIKTKIVIKAYLNKVNIVSRFIKIH